MLKKYIAVAYGTSSNSGVMTLENANNWAREHLSGNHNKNKKVFITEVISIAEPQLSPIVIKPFVPEEVAPTVKVAPARPTPAEKYDNDSSPGNAFRRHQTDNHSSFSAPLSDGA